MERETGKKINTILQLRLHPAIIALKNNSKELTINKKVDVDLTYITCRGRWYQVSWKGDISKSGGIATNIGIHFFDMLQWIFGPTQWNVVHLSQATEAAGYLELEHARVRWYLSLENSDLPEAVKKSGKQSYRSIKVNDQELDFSEGFTELHTLSYKEIIAGKGFGLEDARPCIETVFEIRNATVAPLRGDYHPFIKNGGR